MTFEELLDQVDQLDVKERERLYEYLEQKRHEDRLRQFDQAVQQLREGLSREEIDVIKSAINSEGYINPADEDQWQE